MKHAAASLRALDLVITLRVALGLDPRSPPPAMAVLPPMPLDLVVLAVDLHAWISWAVGCLPLFSGGLPTGGWARAELSRLLVALAMVRADGSITRASRILDTSRSRLRTMLKDMEMYPWRAAVARLRDRDATPRIERGEGKPNADQHATSERASGALGDVGIEESDRAGLIDFRFETLTEGRAWLCRDDQREAMWGGALVHVQVAYAYAAEFGHAIVAKRE